MIKKVILSIAIVAAASLSSFAANDNKGSDNKQSTECSGKCSDCNKECNKVKPGKHGRNGFGMRAFEGIDLTEAQKTQLETLRADFKAKKEAAMKNKGENKTKKENLTEEQKKQLKAEKMAKRQQEKQEFDNKVKSILTPEQYTKYLDNAKKMADNKGKAMHRSHKHAKHHKHARVAGKSHKNAKYSKKANRSSKNANGNDTKA